MCVLFNYGLNRSEWYNELRFKYLESFSVFLGKKIRDRRRACGFETQSALADAIGVDRTRVSRWEKGQNIPSKQLRETLKRILNVDDSFFKPTAPGPLTPDKSLLILEIVALLPGIDVNNLEVILDLLRAANSRSTSRTKAR